MEAVKKYQRRLIPVNIVIMILCAISVLSLMYMPLITVDMGNVPTEVIREFFEVENGYSEGHEGAVATAQNDSVVETAQNEIIVKAARNFKISFSTSTLAKFAFSEEPTKILIAELVKTIAPVADQIVVDVIVQNAINSYIDDNTKKVLENAGINIDNFDTLSVLNELNKLSDPSADVNEVFESFGDKLQEQFIDRETGKSLITDEDLNNFRQDFIDVYEETMDKLEKVSAETGENINFSLEAFVCTFASELLAEDEDEEVIYTNYEDLLNAFLNGEINLGKLTGSTSPSTVARLASAPSDSDDPTAELRETLQTISDYCKYIVIAMFFFIGVWVLLFLFALLHLLLSNKKVSMWYVKLFGGFPCLLFVVIPWLVLTLGPVILPMIPDIAGAVTYLPLLLALSSLAWVSGICYVLLWLVSIFWAHPIKKKIRKATRAAKMA